jgi:hypothetical protein
MTRSHGLLGLLVIGALGCGSETPATPSVMQVTLPVIPIPGPGEIRAQDGTPATSDTTPVYEVRRMQRVLAPGGRHVTRGEFNAVTGSAVITCTGTATRVEMTLSGLIPNGVYTIWHSSFRAPGFDGTYNNQNGLGVVGASDGSQGTVRASATGTGRISFTTAAGPLSVTGRLGSCMLADEFESDLAGWYHIDGQTYGGSPGPDGTAVTQFAVLWRRPQDAGR